MKVTIEHYIATNNPNEAQAVLSKYGVKVKNMPDMIRKIHAVMKHYGERAVKDFASINTPYRSLLLSTLPAATPTPTPIPEKKSSACGCESSADGSEESSNACGCSGVNGEETSGCDGNGVCNCGKKSSKVSNAEGDKKVVPPVTETKAEAPKESTEKTDASKPAKETPAPTKAEKEKTDMMPFVIVGAVALIAVVVIAKS